MLGFLKKLVFKLKREKDIITKLKDRGVKIGSNVSIINSNIDGGHGYLVTIGNNVTITHATILAHDASTKKFIGYTKVGRVDIGNDVFIGYGAIILPNTKIGNKVIVGAGAVVASDIPDNSVVIGNPCKIICSFDNYIEKHREQLHTKPKFNTYGINKSDAEKKQMYHDLESTMGYDL